MTRRRSDRIAAYGLILIGLALCLWSAAVQDDNYQLTDKQIKQHALNVEARLGEE